VAPEPRVVAFGIFDERTAKFRREHCRQHGADGSPACLRIVEKEQAAVIHP
jgi:hypothetical protein